MVEEIIDKTYPWGFFDGSSAGEPKVCGASGMLYFVEDHYFTFKAGLGYGTINFVELIGLKLLLTLALDKHITKLEVFGDSQLVINWVLHEVIIFSDMFEFVDFKHIYREINSLANELAKDGSHVLVGSGRFLSIVHLKFL